MTASILGLKHLHARCNVALSMPTNAASIAVLSPSSSMTSHWDAETCLWPFQLRSIRSSSRDLNLGCWEARILWTKTYWRYLRVNFESNDLYEPMYRPAEKHMAFQTPWFPSTASLQSPERATIALGHPKSAFESFQRLRGAFFQVILPHWHTGTFVGLF